MTSAHQRRSSSSTRKQLNHHGTTRGHGSHPIVSDESYFNTPHLFNRLLTESYWPSTSSPSQSLTSSVTMSDSEEHSKKSKRSKSSSKSSSSSSSRAQRGRRTAPSSTHRCEICNQYYSRRDNLRVHQRVHSGEMPYECSYCGQRFRWMGAMRTHESNHVRDGHSRSSQQGGSSSNSAQRQHSSHRTSSGRDNRGRSDRQSSRRQDSNTTADSSSSSGRNSSGREHRSSNNGSSRSRANPSELRLEDNQVRQGESEIVTQLDSLISPLVHEPWHHVLDDDRN